MNRLPIILLSSMLLILLVGFMVLRSPFAERNTSTPQPFTDEQVKTLFQTRGCISCHDSKHTLVGPSFEAIATRYHNEPEAQSILLASLRNGSQGKWGAQSMLKYEPARLPEHEAEAMLAWLLKNHESSQP